MAGLTLLALLIPAYVRSGRHAKLVHCQENLRQLHRAQQGAKKDPAKLGMSYWTQLGVGPEILRCPFVSGQVARPCDYLGPRSDPAGLDAGDAIGCDIPENHDERGRMGGNVLYKSGEVRALHPREGGGADDPWREAAQRKCGP